MSPNELALQRWAARLDGAAYVGLLAILLWVSWPLGSNRNWSVSLLAIATWASLILAAASRVLSPASFKASVVRTGWIPLGALCGFALLLVFQLTWRPADNHVLSIDPFATRLYLMTTLAYLGAWALVQLTVRTAERADRLLLAIVVAGVAQAIAAVVLHAVGASYVFLHTSFDQGSRAMGTFPSPDHLAGYLELCLSAGIGWLLSRLGRDAGEEASHWRARVVNALAFVMSGKMLLRLLLVVMVIALVMTHSRMGNGAFFVSIAIVGGVVALCSRQLRRPALWLVASMVLVDILVVGQWVGLDQVVQRLQNTAEASSKTIAGFGLAAAPPPQEESFAQRLEVPKLSLRLVADRPWLGHGGGTYYTAFPPYKVPGLPWHWDYAHNDYVQVACDAGLVGLALWLVAGIASLLRAVRLLDDARPRAQRGVGVAALLAICCMGLHSMVDFNMHIPSTAFTFTVLLAATWSVREARRAKGKRRTRARRETAEPELGVAA